MNNTVLKKQFFSLLLILSLVSSVTTASIYIVGGLENDLSAISPQTVALRYKYIGYYDEQHIKYGYLYWNQKNWALTGEINRNDDLPVSSLYYEDNDWERMLYPQYSITKPWQVVSEDYQLSAQADPASAPFTFMLFIVLFLGFLSQFSKKVYNRARILFDAVISTAALAITLPVMIVAAILIKLNSPGPVFYKQIRVGLNRRKRRKSTQHNIVEKKRNGDNLGSLFVIYKLRTMYCNAERGTGPVWAKQNDDRITSIGRFLRKTRLDEVPQFFNVLKGEMSIIGPRPERPEFVRQLNKSICHYYKRYYVKPGITGLAQVRFHYASSISDTKKKLRYDLLYLRKGSLLIDLRILLSTFTTVFLAKGAR